MIFKVDRSPEKVRQVEKGEFSAVDILLIIYTTLKKLKDKASIILWSSFILLMLWGFHGDMEILTSLLGEDWTQKITFGLVWGKELVSFIVGFILVVVIPSLIIKFRFKSKLRDFGLGLPEKCQRGKAVVAFFTLLGITSIFIFIASFQEGMQQEYPLFAQPHLDKARTITLWSEFVIYELIYLLFFITIEFAFRGYLLFGLYSIRMSPNAENNRKGSIQRFGVYSILIQMLAYTTWHYGKPVAEMGGTIVWGVAVAAIALRIGSIWPIIIPHWLYNVFLDLLIWKNLNKKILNFFT